MTETEIVNLALAKLGASLIVRLGDASIPGSHFGKLLYLPTLGRVLREFHWSFATREASLAQLPERETAHWLYSYALPPKFVRLLELQSDHLYLPHNEFSRTGKHLHCNVSPARLKYITSDLVPDDFDADFREAFVVLLASEMATPLLQSPQLGQTLLQEYLTAALPNAKAIDARETQSRENHGPYRAIAESPLVQSRFFRSGNNYTYDQ